MEMGDRRLVVRVSDDQVEMFTNCTVELVSGANDVLNIIGIKGKDKGVVIASFNRWMYWRCEDN